MTYLLALHLKYHLTGVESLNHLHQVELFSSDWLFLYSSVATLVSMDVAVNFCIHTLFLAPYSRLFTTWEPLSQGDEEDGHNGSSYVVMPFWHEIWSHEFKCILGDWDRYQLPGLTLCYYFMQQQRESDGIVMGIGLSPECEQVESFWELPNCQIAMESRRHACMLPRRPEIRSCFGPEY